MPLDNKDILFASLFGSRSVQLIENANTINNELAKRVLPPIPFLPLKNTIKVDNTNLESLDYQVNEQWSAQETIDESKQFFPLSFSFTEKGTKWTFPYEPMINISSGNNIIKRNVAKQGDELIGTIKERWSRKDFDITVTGVLIGSLLTGEPEVSFPKAKMQELFNFLKHNKSIYIYSHPLEILGITKVVVEDYSFPFTKGENVQAYELKLVSDFSYNLFIKEEF